MKTHKQEFWELSQRDLELTRLMESANAWSSKEDGEQIISYSVAEARHHPHCDGCASTEQRLDLGYGHCSTFPNVNSDLIFFYTESSSAQSSLNFCEGFMIYAERWLRSM